MKILLLSEMFPPMTGGSGRWLWEVYRRMPSDQFVIAAGQHASGADFEASHDLDVRRLPFNLDERGLHNWQTLRCYWGLFRKLCRIVREENCTSIHCGCCLPEGWLAYLFRKFYGLPYVCYVRGEEIDAVRSSRDLSWMVRGILHHSQRLIVGSQNTARLLNESWGIPKRQVQILYPGVDTTWFVPAARDEFVLKQHGWKDRVVVLTAGAMQSHQGHRIAIRALSAIGEAVPNVVYSVFGNGEQRDSLEQLAREERVENLVEFRDGVSREDMLRCYQQCDLFALPDGRQVKGIEDSVRGLLEAQSCGRAVLAGDSGSAPEFLQPGETGVVIPWDDVNQVAAGMTRLLLASEELREMGSRARAWAVDHFDWSVLSRQAADLFGLTLRSWADIPAAVDRSAESQTRTGTGFVQNQNGISLFPD